MTKNMILQDYSPSRVALALDKNMIAFGTFLSTLPRATLYDEPGILWFETNVESSVFNGVLQSRVRPEMLPPAIEQVLSHFQQRHLAFHWHLGPCSQPSNFGNLLEAYGFSHGEDEPGMAVDLCSFNEDLPVVSKLTIQPVIAKNLIHQWSRVTYCGAPENEIHNVFTVYSGLPLDSQSPLRLYLGTVAGEPVATASLFFAAGVAYIARVVTIQAFRQQGIGATMTLHAMREACRAGYRIAVLKASPMGFNIYRRLSFKECCLISTYEKYPTNNS